MAGRPCKVCGLKKTHPEAFRLITEEISKEKRKAKIKQLIGTLTERFSLKVNGVNIHRHKEHLLRKAEKNSKKEDTQPEMEIYSKEGELQYSNIKEIIDSLSQEHKLFGNLYVNKYHHNGTRTYKKVYGTDIDSDTAAAAASRLLRNVNISAYVKHLNQLKADSIGLTTSYVLEGLMEVKDRCMEATPVLTKEGIETGDYIFNAPGANKALELLGKHLSMWDKKEQPTDQIKYKQILEDLLNNKLNPFTAGIELGKAGLEMPEVIKIAMRKVDPSILDKPAIMDSDDMGEYSDDELARVANGEINE